MRDRGPKGEYLCWALLSFMGVLAIIVLLSSCGSFQGGKIKIGGKVIEVSNPLEKEMHRVKDKLKRATNKIKDCVRYNSLGDLRLREKNTKIKPKVKKKESDFFDW